MKNRRDLVDALVAKYDKKRKIDPEGLVTVEIDDLVDSGRGALRCVSCRSEVRIRCIAVPGTVWIALLRLWLPGAVGVDDDGSGIE